ncbi:hypothetical protein PHMEG_0008667 [Phytophthora megakarya]|uniref:CCHC-type domain-containing protein n=1 Tax=Phytophthora megakarya TaxID=4795 RepID=A0A225WIY3_9STRA|nr:hypothetical protein PHMEG_0008667 [Phytophthora megakarya]
MRTDRRVTADTPCFVCGQAGHWAAQCTNDPKCYACSKLGHVAHEYTDTEAKVRYDEYLAKRVQRRGKRRPDGLEESRRTDEERQP